MRVSRAVRPALAAAGVLAAAAGVSLGLKAAAPQEPRIEMGEKAGGRALVSSNQAVTPAGAVRRVPGARPKDIAVSPDGRTVAVLAQNKVLFYAPDGTEQGETGVAPGPLGIAWAPDGGTLYVSAERPQVLRLARSGDAWKATEPITVAEIVEQPVETSRSTGRTNSPNGRTLVPIETPSGPKGNPQVAGLAVSPDGKTLYAALGVRNAVAVVDLASGKTTAAIATGVSPYRLALSPDGKTLIVANRGGRAAEGKEPSAPSAGTPVRVDPKTDAALSGSLTFVDTASLAARDVPAGRQPSDIAFTKDGKTAYVANSDDDTVSVVDVPGRRIRTSFTVRPAEDPGFGQMPSSLALSEDGSKLYVACGGGNAVAVVGTKDRRVRGYIPAGWFPIAVAERAGRVFVASAKGFGSRNPTPPGSSGGQVVTGKAYNVHSTVGTVQFLAPGDAKDLAGLTRQVAANNRWGAYEEPARKGRKPVPVPERVGEPSVFKHVVYIIKENHTYDLDLGDMPEGNGDKNLCIFPEEVTPNEHAIARQFVLLDNTYTSGTNSADGHQWTDSALANGYMEQNYSSYARSYPYDGGDPLAYSPKGFLWTQAIQHKKSLRDYGEFVNRPKVVDPETGKEPTWTQLWEERKNGTHLYEITPGTDNAALRPYLRAHYVGWPITVSDQYRADVFLSDLKEYEESGAMPQLSILLLPANHTSGGAPGFPTPRASVADNDLALGRIVEGISHSRFWKDTLILVIEDDSQFGLDHVDGHRTVAFCVSAYTKRGAVVSVPYNHTSFLRTMELVLGLPAMNRFDRTATPMAACFTAQPDLSPYTVRENRVPIDEINKATAALHGEAKRLALASQRADWTRYDRADPVVVARAAWVAQRPGEPFPWAQFRPNRDADD